jgi:hypothetical protein
MKTLAALLVALLLAACENEGPLERAGEATDEAAEDVGDTAESAVDAIDHAIDDVEDEVEGAAEWAGSDFAPRGRSQHATRRLREHSLVGFLATRVATASRRFESAHAANFEIATTVANELTALQRASGSCHAGAPHAQHACEKLLSDVRPVRMRAIPRHQ